MSLSAAVIVFVAIVAYHNSFAGPFVLDDISSIVTRNPTIRHLWPIWPTLSPPEGGLTVSGRPLVNVSLAINYAISGLGVWSYHALNLAIHILAALALFAVLRRTFLLSALRSRFGHASTLLALVAAMIWAVHPLLTASVTYVVQRAESMAGLFYLLTLYCVVRSTQSARVRSWHMAAVAACLAGMATKEAMATAPLVVLLYDRTFLAGSFRQALRRRRALYMALAGTWALLGWLVLSGGGRGGTAGFQIPIDWRAYALTQIGAVVRYLRLSVFPSHLVFDYGTTLVTSPAEIAPRAIVVLLLLAASLLAVWRRRAAGFLGIWFFAVLAPTSSVIPVATQTMAEHRMYLALAAVVVLAVTSAYMLWGRLTARVEHWSRAARLAVPVVAVAMAMGALGYATVRRNADYRSGVSIWQDTVRKRPDNSRARFNLGRVLAAMGRTQEAITNYEAGLQIDPYSISAHKELGVALAGLGRKQEAIEQYRKALQLNPDDAEVHSNLGVALAGVGRTSEAVEHFERASKAGLDIAAVHSNLGVVLAGIGRTRDAIEHFKRALQLTPDIPGGHYKLGVLLQGEGSTKEAIEQYEQAIDLDPGNPEALNKLAWLLATRGPDRDGGPARAVTLAQQACKMTGDSVATFLDTKAVALAAANRFPEAVATAREALARTGGNFELAKQVQGRLSLYVANRAYLEPDRPPGTAR